MRISEKTLDVLKNYSTINQSIYVRPGNKISTVSPQKTVLSEYVCDEQFETSFGVYNLPEFLGCISLFDRPELTFRGTNLEIKSTDADGGVVQYYFCDQNMVQAAPENHKINLDDAASFVLEGDVLKRLTRAASILGLEEMQMRSRNGRILLRCVNTKNKTSNNMEFDVGETNKEFNVRINTEYFNIIPGTYNVEVTPRVVKFQDTEGRLTYYMAATTEK